MLSLASSGRGVLPLQQRREIDAVEQLHDDVDVGVGFVQLVNGDDVAMVQPCGRPRFLNEALPELRVIVQLGRHLLDGDLAIEHVVVRFVDHPHGAFPKAFEDRVPAVENLLVDGEPPVYAGPGEKENDSAYREGGILPSCNRAAANASLP